MQLALWYVGGDKSSFVDMLSAFSKADLLKYSILKMQLSSMCTCYESLAGVEIPVAILLAVRSGNKSEVQAQSSNPQSLQPVLDIRYAIRGALATIRHNGSPGAIISFPLWDCS